MSITILLNRILEMLPRAASHLVHATLTLEFAALHLAGSCILIQFAVYLIWILFLEIQEIREVMGFWSIRYCENCNSASSCFMCFHFLLCFQHMAHLHHHHLSSDNFGHVCFHESIELLYKYATNISYLK